MRSRQNPGVLKGRRDVLKVLNEEEGRGSDLEAHSRITEKEGWGGDDWKI